MVRFIGDIIRELREDKDIKQKDLAALFNVKENTWSQYETNSRTPDVETIKKIAVYFNVSIDYLLDLTCVKYNPKDPMFQELLIQFMQLNNNQKEIIIDKIRELNGVNL